jgi:hypothetical protein
MGLLLEFRHEALGAKLVFDDDDKAAYAYLKVGDTVVGDVWLYNVVAAPREPEWQQPDGRNRMPFANPADFASKESFRPITDADEIRLDWEAGPDGLKQVSIFLRGQRHAVICPGAKPGWCRLAATPSPVAKPLHAIQESPG